VLKLSKIIASLRAGVVNVTKTKRKESGKRNFCPPALSLSGKALSQLLRQQETLGRSIGKNLWILLGESFNIFH